MFFRPPSSRKVHPRPESVRPFTWASAPPSRSPGRWILSGLAVLSVAILVWYANRKTPEPKPAKSANPVSVPQPRVNAKDQLKYVWIPPGTFMMGASEGDAEAYRGREAGAPGDADEGVLDGADRSDSGGVRSVQGRTAEVGRGVTAGGSELGRGKEVLRMGGDAAAEQRRSGNTRRGRGRPGRGTATWRRPLGILETAAEKRTRWEGKNRTGGACTTR